MNKTITNISFFAILIVIIIVAILVFKNKSTNSTLPSVNNIPTTDNVADKDFIESLSSISDLNLKSKYCGIDTNCTRDFLASNMPASVSVRSDGCFLFDGRVYELEHSPDSDWPSCYNYWYSFEEGVIYTPFIQDKQETKWIALQQTQDRVNIIYINPHKEIKEVIKVLYK